MRLLDMDKSTPLAVSFSGGKDSVATVKLLHEHGFKNVTCIYAHFYFDKVNNIPATLPEHENFVMIKMKRIIENVFNYKFIDVEPEHDFLYHFNTEISKGRYKGLSKGFPLSSPISRCWVNGRLKVSAINKAIKLIGNTTQVIGLAYDEQDRIERIIDNENKFSILNELHITEEMALKICKVHGILSPIYESASRDGCWFCPNSKPAETQYILKNYPELVKTLNSLDVNTRQTRVPANHIKYNNGTWLTVKDFFTRTYKRKENLLTEDEIKLLWENIENGID